MSIEWVRKELQSLGPLNFAVLKAANFRAKRMDRDELVKIRAPNIDTLYCRAGTSDRQVFYEVFVDREYSCLEGVRNPELIVDCGANVGYSSAYFLARYPGATVIAVEPDPHNFAMCERNLLAYRDRCKLVCAGIWSRPAGLMLETNGHEAWAVTVREARESETPDVQATDIPSLLESSGFERISILKIDIEGSEAEVFARECDWLDRVDNIVIELHGPACESIFHRAIHGRGFSVCRYGDLTLCGR